MIKWYLNKAASLDLLNLTVRPHMHNTVNMVAEQGSGPRAAPTEAASSSNAGGQQ